MRNMADGYGRPSPATIQAAERCYVTGATVKSSERGRETRGKRVRARERGARGCSYPLLTPCSGTRRPSADDGVLGHVRANSWRKTMGLGGLG